MDWNNYLEIRARLETIEKKIDYVIENTIGFPENKNTQPAPQNNIS